MNVHTKLQLHSRNEYAFSFHILIFLFKYLRTPDLLSQQITFNQVNA